MSMSDNPYRSPASPGQAVGVKSGLRGDVRSVAVYQKGILYCILLHIAALVGQFVVPPQFRLAIILGDVVVAIAGFVFVLLLAIKVYNVAVGIILGILTLVPCVNLIVLLVVNGKATGILQANGHKVGLLGANLSEFN
jgi:hypothetical protein